MATSWILVAAAATILAVVLTGCGSGGGGGGTSPTGSCGQAKKPNVYPGCENVDLGSCGNACCNLMLKVELSPDDFEKKVVDTISKNGGSDGEYTLQETAAGTLGFYNLTKMSSQLPVPFKGSKSVWIGQVHHKSFGPKHYVDMINFNMRSGSDGKTSIVHAFSLSLIGGALGDSGQNYKNIMGVMSGIKFNVLEHLGGSCAAPAAQHLTTKAPKASIARSLSTQDNNKLTRTSASFADKKKGSCGSEHPSKVEDCQNVDFGSCGNACCSLLIHQKYAPDVAVQKLNDTLSKGGPDGYYTLQMTAEGSLGFADLTDHTKSGLPSPLNSTSGLYIGQVHHMTSGPKHYNDTINFNIYKSDSDEGCYVHATSVSLIGGAFGDNGQNYKNIKMILKKAFGEWTEEDHLFNSCPAAPSRVLV